MPDPVKNAPEEHTEKTKLTNDDFRRLLMTPRVTTATPSLPGNKPQEILKNVHAPSEDKAERRRKKKIFYAKLKRQEDDKLAELAEKYRDRAKERRDGQNPDYQAVEDPLAVHAGYRAVAPDVKSGMDAAERRRQMIQESKFLGGDMEHTHLVKGLDFALLQKVRSEIQQVEADHEEELEELVSKPKKDKGSKKEEAEIQFKTRNIYKVVMGNKELERNPLFAPGRMAYVVDLTDEMDTDIPTTVIRSKADVPSLEEKPMMTTNDIVINKLAQILSYLRQGSKHSKKHKKREKMQMGEDNIYENIGDYVPAQEKRGRDRGKDSRKKTSNYFKDTGTTEKDVRNEPVAGFRKDNRQKLVVDDGRALLSKLSAEPTGYAECYPGLEEMHDAIEDSDDEADYTKMDLGGKKGPVGRWDFDTPEEYGNYMNTKEALPKAAFQYGLKMVDGRRTRKFNKEKNERAELDREWNKIQNIIQKRKPDGEAKTPNFKIPRY